MDEALAYLREHESDSLDAVVTGLLCRNDQDSVARLLIRRLKDENQRAEMLGYIQTYTPATASTAIQRTLATRRAEVLRRPDVEVAVRAVGRIESWPLQAKTY